MKKLSLTMLTLAVCTLGLTACPGTNAQGADAIKVGILQPVEHEALDAAREGFKQGLAENGYGSGKVEFIYRNASGNDADVVSFAKDLVSTCDLYLGIGTGASKALKSAAEDKGLIKPCLFTAVTDPVDAGLVESLENGKGFVTGTSDMQPIAAQIDLIQECIPSVDKVGILYTQGESNSVIQKNQAEAALTAKGITAVPQACTNASDVSAAALALANTTGLDAIYIPTDNNIAANTDAVKTAVQNKGILVVTGEENMMKGCGAATLSIDYTALGKVTGEMAAKILKEDLVPGKLPVRSMSAGDCEYVISSANCADANVTLPASVIAKSRDVSAAI